jgi:hypothetical protein
VQLTTDSGKSWTNFRGKIPGMPTGGWIPQIRASRYLASEAFVVINDYRRGDFKPYVFRTIDFGKTWTRLIDENKVKGYALCILQDPAEPNLIFAGTEHGLWVSLDNGFSFQQWKNGYPSVSTYDLAIQEREADLAIATFGRSMWILDDIRPLRQLASSKGKTPATLKVFPVPDAYQINYRPALGYEWSLAGIYDAENRRSGAMVSLFVPRIPEKAKENSNKPNSENVAAPPRSRGGRSGGGSAQPAAKASDSISVEIYSPQQEKIRSLKWGIDTGFNRLYWELEEKGYRQPGSPKPKPGSPEPSGLPVMPGKYKIILRLGQESDSAYVTVKDDPRTGNMNDSKLAQREKYTRLRKSSDKLTEALDRISEAGEILTKMTGQLQNIEGKEADTLVKATKALQDSIKSIKEFIQGKPAEKQGISRSSAPTVMSRMQEAALYIGATDLPPGKQEDELLKIAEKVIGEAVQKTNTFFNQPWKNYKKLVEETKINLFKEYTPIE